MTLWRRIWHSIKKESALPQVLLDPIQFEVQVHLQKWMVLEESMEKTLMSTLHICNSRKTRNYSS